MSYPPIQFARGRHDENGQSPSPEFKIFLTTFTPRCSLANTLSFGHGGQVLGTEGTGERCISVERGYRGYRSPESRTRYLKHCASKAVFGSISTIGTIRVSILWVLLTDSELKFIQGATVNWMDYVELWLACAEVCAALDRGLRGKKMNNTNSVCEANGQLTK